MTPSPCLPSQRITRDDVTDDFAKFIKLTSSKRFARAEKFFWKSFTKITMGILAKLCTECMSVECVMEFGTRRWHDQDVLLLLFSRCFFLLLRLLYISLNVITAVNPVFHRMVAAVECQCTRIRTLLWPNYRNEGAPSFSVWIISITLAWFISFVAKWDCEWFRVKKCEMMKLQNCTKKKLVTSRMRNDEYSCFGRFPNAHPSRTSSTHRTGNPLNRILLNGDVLTQDEIKEKQLISIRTKK